MKRVILAVLLICSAASWISAEQISPQEFSQTLLLNSLLPGIAQLRHGDKREGAWLMGASLACSLIGNGLIIGYGWEEWTDTDLELGLYSHEGRTYLFPPPNTETLIGKQWMLDTGLALSLWGSLFSAYSSWAFYRDYADTRSEIGLRIGRESLAGLLLAPYKRENLLSWDFFPFFPMTVVAGLEYEDVEGIQRFFSQDTVTFWGRELKPLTGLTLNTLFVLFLVHANATVEEIMYRGISLEANGTVYSSLTFGAAHLPNMLVPGISVEDTILQTLFATLFGLYAADRTRRGGYNYQKMIALHFWHNVTAFTLNYLTEADTEPGFTWRMQFRF